MFNYSIHCMLTSTIFSYLQPLTHVMARHIVASFKPSKPVLLALSLQDTSRETVFALLPIIQSCVSKAQRGTSAQPIKEEAQVKWSMVPATCLVMCDWGMWELVTPWICERFLSRDWIYLSNPRISHSAKRFSQMMGVILPLDQPIVE